MVVPDFDNPATVYSSNKEIAKDNESFLPRHIFSYIAPANGWLQVIDCYNPFDWSLFIGPSGLAEGMNVGPRYRAYHKCGASYSDNGFFPVRKNDEINGVLYYQDPFWKRAHGGTPNFATIIIFYPAKIIL